MCTTLENTKLKMSITIKYALHLKIYISKYKYDLVTDNYNHFIKMFGITFLL